jgi:hypothetical protein
MFMLNSLGPLLTAVRIEKINRSPVEPTNQQTETMYANNEQRSKGKLVDSAQKNINNGFNYMNDNHMRNSTLSNNHGNQGSRKCCLKMPTNCQPKQHSTKQYSANGQPFLKKSVTNVSKKLPMECYNCTEDVPLNAWDTPTNNGEAANFCYNI